MADGQYTQAEVDRMIEAAIRERTKNHADQLKAKDREIAELATKAAEYDRVAGERDRVRQEFEAHKAQAAEDALFTGLGVTDAATRRALKALHGAADVAEGQQRPGLGDWLTEQRAAADSVVARLLGPPPAGQGAQPGTAPAPGAPPASQQPGTPAPVRQPATTTGVGLPPAVAPSKLTRAQYEAEHRSLLDKAATLVGAEREAAMAEARNYLTTYAAKVDG